jgi:hypothetical protein
MGRLEPVVVLPHFPQRQTDALLSFAAVHRWPPPFEHVPASGLLLLPVVFPHFVHFHVPIIFLLVRFVFQVVPFVLMALTASSRLAFMPAPSSCAPLRSQRFHHADIAAFAVFETAVFDGAEAGREEEFITIYTPLCFLQRK